MVQNALKKLLKFGTVANFVGYDALNDFFPTYTLRPNPECDNRKCRAAVSSHAEKATESSVVATAVAAPVVHEDGNDWGIEVEDTEEPDAEQKRAQQLQQKLKGAGLEQKYDATKEKVAEGDLVQVGDESVDELSAALAAM